MRQPVQRWQFQSSNKGRSGISVSNVLIRECFSCDMNETRGCHAGYIGCGKYKEWWTPMVWYVEAIHKRLCL